MTDIVIKVENLSKRYRLGERQAGYKTLRESIQNLMLRRFRTGFKTIIPKAASPVPVENSVAFDGRSIWALRDVTFEVARGDVVGIIGRNGAGKSTLLKILSKITEPTTGRIEIDGRVGSLLEVGTGFHPELSGKDNVYLYGAILGMDRYEVSRKFNEIVAFAEMEAFLDTPVKRYSSGMYMRLAFSVAAHLNPEILLVDEVLAVGDWVFQNKCLEKMEAVSKQGKTVLLVSHNIAAISALCTKSILFKRGSLGLSGDTETVISEYIRHLRSLGKTRLCERSDRQGNGALKFTSLCLRDKDGNPVSRVRSGDPLTISLEYVAKGGARLKDVHFSIGVHGRLNNRLFHLGTNVVQKDFEAIPPSGWASCEIDRVPLQPGRYPVNIYCTVGGDIADWVQEAGIVEIESGDYFGTGKLPPIEQGESLVDHRWDVRAGFDAC